MVIASKINFKATTSTNTDNKTEFPPENEWKNKYMNEWMIGSHSSHRTATFSVIIWCWQIHIVVGFVVVVVVCKKKKEKKGMTHLAKMLQLQPNFDFDWDDTGWHWSRSFPNYYPSTKLSWTQQFPAYYQANAWEICLAACLLSSHFMHLFPNNVPLLSPYLWRRRC